MKPAIQFSTEGGYDPTHHVVPWPLFEVGPVTVTNHLLMGFVAMLLVLWLCFHAASRIRVRGGGVEGYMTRGRVAQTFEVICVFLREEVARPALGKLTDRYIGYVWSMFFFILVCNLLGLLPIGPVLSYTVQPLVGMFTDHPVNLEHWGGTATGSLALTGAMALVSFVMFHFVGLRHQGVHYFAHFAPVPLWPIMKGGTVMMLPIALLLVVVEAIGSLIKAVALAIRLFANMVGGHLAPAALVGIILLFGSYLVAGTVVVALVALFMLELFIAFLQAYIFTMLTVIFIAMGAVHEEHGEEGHGAGHGGEGHGHGSASTAGAGH